MIFGTLQCALLVAALGRAGGERWRRPDDAEAAESVRIDAKVGFVDDQPTRRRNNRQDIQADDISSQQPQGSYRPARYPDRDLRINGRPAYNDGYINEKYQDGTLDSLQYCKCVSTPNCEVRTDYANACGANQYLCCYKNPQQNEQQPEYFNEVDDVRPMLFPGQSNKPGLLPRPNYDNNVFGPGQGQGAFQSQAGTLVGPDGPTGVVGPNKPGVAFPERPVLVGPSGPTGVIGPDGPAGVKGPANDRPVLVGPDGPTGIIGPGNNRPVHVGPSGPTGVKGSANDRPVLVGPDGPTGVIGPSNNRPVLVGPGGPTGVTGPDNNRPVLVGPGGPTGIIGPANDDRNDNLLVRPLGSSHDTRPSETAQRGVLVGPGGPTGIIGPAFDLPYLFGSSGFGGSARPVLVGPGGPTGTIGPRLVGPGGPTGRIGPDFNRRTRGPGILVGPGGPTGRIGPRNFFGI